MQCISINCYENVKAAGDTCSRIIVGLRTGTPAQYLSNTGTRSRVFTGMDRLI